MDRDQVGVGPSRPAITADVVIIGGGAAGLAAARALHDAHLRVVVLEARPRIGGRVFTRRVPGLALPVELGAEFVHGRVRETLAIADEARAFSWVRCRTPGGASLAASCTRPATTKLGHRQG